MINIKIEEKKQSIRERKPSWPPTLAHIVCKDKKLERQNLLRKKITGKKKKKQLEKENIARMRNCPDVTILNTLVGQGQIGDFLHRIILLLSVVKEDLTKKEKIGKQFD